MGRPFGEYELDKLLHELEETLMNYFGTQNEIRLGLNAIVPEKPQALIYLEQREEFGALPFGGGFLDQPYILMMEMKRCADIRSVFTSFHKQQSPKDPGV